MSKQLFVDNSINPTKQKLIGKIQKKCPKCRGYGTTSQIMMVDIPGLTTPRRPLKKFSSPFTCKQCGDSGYVPIFDNIIR